MHPEPGRQKNICARKDNNCLSPTKIVLLQDEIEQDENVFLFVLLAVRICFLHFIRILQGAPCAVHHRRIPVQQRRMAAKDESRNAARSIVASGNYLGYTIGGG
jgi:hypothetical protein